MGKNKMDKEDAIDYLNEKGRFLSQKYQNWEEDKEKVTEEQAVKADEAEIRKVMKSGKIYGDPVVQLFD